MPRIRLLSISALAGLLAFPALAQAVEIVGRVMNRTTTQPVAGQEITLLGLRGGMVALDTRESDEAGRFRFIRDANPNENFLVRVAYRGVNYHQPVILAGGDRIEANLDVYDTTAESAGIEVESHIFFLEPAPDRVRVVEVFVFNNQSRPPRTYVPEASRPSLLVFRAPADAGQDVRAFIVGPGGMPIQQQPQPADEPHTHTLDYPLRPGTTQIEFSYVVPLQQNRYDFSKRVGRAASPPRIVTPLAGIRLTGKSLGAPQEEPSRQVRLYTATLAGENELRFRIEVDPAALAALPQQEPPQAGTSATGAGAAGEGSVTLIPNPVSEAKWYIVGLTLAVLVLGLYYLYSLPPTGRTPDEPKLKSQARR